MNHREYHMNSAFSTLPQFEISQFEITDTVARCSGVIKNIATLSNAESGERVTICVNQNKFIWGRLSEINLQSFQTTVDVSFVVSREYLEICRVYPFLSGYWGDMAELVFDNSIIWKRVKFKPHDSTRYHPDGRVEIVKGGWDHEHCQICKQTISTYENDDHYGYANQDDNWLCDSCYHKYVLKKSLDFIILDQVF